MKDMCKLPNKKYAVIYADPPWGYRNRASYGAAEDHYRTMDLEAIKELPVGDIAAEHCVLFMWATFPLLPEALDAMRAWGFRYKTLGFLWVKLNRKSTSLFWGLGNWTRANPEICLLGIKGKPRRISASVHSVIVSTLERHSKKPDEVRRRIEHLMGDVPRIELFARQKTDGWDVWGDEV